MDQFIFEDGNEVSVLQMEIDDPNFLLGDVTSFNDFLDLKPLERQKETISDKVKGEDSCENAASTLRTHCKYKREDLEHFFFTVNEKSVRGAAKHLKIPLDKFVEDRLVDLQS
ncbi:hypothetical protein K501DRAFT_184351 [Backusella circina FSU 941]|nr:hypothetical protein K501DRAFT_184351 [Backusella circina FSU 941]